MNDLLTFKLYLAFKDPVRNSCVSLFFLLDRH